MSQVVIFEAVVDRLGCPRSAVVEAVNDNRSGNIPTIVINWKLLGRGWTIARFYDSRVDIAQKTMFKNKSRSFAYDDPEFLDYLMTMLSCAPAGCYAMATMSWVAYVLMSIATILVVAVRLMVTACLNGLESIIKRLFR